MTKNRMVDSRCSILLVDIGRFFFLGGGEIFGEKPGEKETWATPELSW